MPVRKLLRAFVLINLNLLTLLSVSCSSRVNVGDVVGSYKAVYPFGQSLLVLRTDRTFTQSVVVAGEPPCSATGTWSFKERESKLALHGALALDDGFGHLKKNWRTRVDSTSIAVERIWFKVSIEDSSEYPHEKVN